MRRASILTALLAVCLSGGCGNTSASAPVACLDGPAQYRQALEGAPHGVRLPGGARISECLAENQEAGALASVGGAMLGAATKLNAEARAAQGGEAGVRLGYLIGAAQAGAETTDGIHAELMRRLIAAATYNRRGSVSKGFERAYREGFEAG